MEKNVNSSLEISTEINSKFWNKSEKITNNITIWIKIFSFIIYGIFFAIIISLQFITQPQQVGSSNLVMTNTILMFVLVFVGLISIVMLNFATNSYNKIWKMKYLLLHLLNSILLIVVAVIPASITISSDLTQVNNDLVIWALVVAITILVYSLLFAGMLIISGVLSKNSFPISWTKTLIVLPVLLAQIVIGFIIYVSASSFAEVATGAGNFNTGIILLYIALAVAIIALIYIIISFLFISAFKSQLFTDKTNRELLKIQSNRDYKYFGVFVTSIVLIAGAVIFKNTAFSNTNLNINFIFIINLVVLIIALCGYLYLMFSSNYTKKIITKNENTIQLKNLFISNLFNWIFILIAAISTYFSAVVGANSSTPDIIITFAIFWIVKSIINIAAGFKFPNIKNATITIIMSSVMLFVSLFTLILLTIPDTSAIKTFLTDASMLILISTIFAGLSINFIITILSVQKAYAKDRDRKIELKARNIKLKNQKQLLSKINE